VRRTASLMDLAHFCFPFLARDVQMLRVAVGRFTEGGLDRAGETTDDSTEVIN
jgi:hypothetical protein